jgi:hemolysin III
MEHAKPLLRGHFHQAAFFCALGACAMLLAKVHSVHVLVPTLIYCLSLVGMFGISALYHRPRWGETGRTWMKRIDHSAIFVLIAGTGTPICLLALPGDSGLKLLATLWIAAGFGIIKCVFWVHSPKWVSSVLYVLVGWISLSYLQEIHLSIGNQQFMYLVAGGVVYSVGAVNYALKWPNPNPEFLGYHEIFHLLVIAGAIFHFLVIQPLIV